MVAESREESMVVTAHGGVDEGLGKGTMVMMDGDGALAE